MVTIRDVTDFLDITDSRKNEPEPPASAVSGKQNPNQQNQKGEFVVKKKEVLHQWDALSRNKMSPMAGIKENRTLVVIGVVVGLLFLLMQEFLLITVVAALIFLKYVLSSSEGERVHHRILNIGVEYSGELYTWDELKLFFFSNSDGVPKLCVDTTERFPSRLFFIINPEDREKIKSILEDYLPYLKEEPETFTDKAYNFVSDKITLGK